MNPHVLELVPMSCQSPMQNLAGKATLREVEVSACVSFAAVRCNYQYKRSLTIAGQQTFPSLTLFLTHKEEKL